MTFTPPSTSLGGPTTDPDHPEQGASPQADEAPFHPSIYALVTPTSATFYPLDLPYADQLSLLGGSAQRCWYSLMLPLQATEALLCWTYHVTEERDELIYSHQEFVAWTDMPPEVLRGPWYTAGDQTIDARDLTQRLKSHQRHAALALHPMTVRVTLTPRGLQLGAHQQELAPYREQLLNVLLHYLDVLPDLPDPEDAHYRAVSAMFKRRDFEGICKLALDALLCEDITLLPLSSPEHADLHYADAFKKKLRRQKLTRLDTVLSVIVAGPERLYAAVEYDTFVIGKHHFEFTTLHTEIDRESYFHLLRSAEESEWSPSVSALVEVRGRLVESQERKMGLSLLN